MMTDPISVPQPDEWHADATRYKMLFRLVPSMNHKMAGTMQPVAMLAGMMTRHLNRELPDVQVLSQNVADMQIACKAAVAARIEVLGWLQPAGPHKISIADGVLQCTNLLSAEIAMNSCTIDNQTARMRTNVEQATLRSLLTAVLFAVLDNAAGPMAVQLRATGDKTRNTTLVVSWTPLAGANTMDTGNMHHRIGWDGVQAIADQEGVKLRRTPDQVDMRFPVAV
jgi:hypothetical protein